MFQHSAVRIYDDQAIGSATDMIYSHGGQMNGSMPILEYLGGYNPGVDPTMRYSLDLSEAQIGALEGSLQEQFKRGINQETYDPLTNNCAQSATEKVLTAAGMADGTNSANTTQGMVGELKSLGLISGQGESPDYLRNTQSQTQENDDDDKQPVN